MDRKTQRREVAEVNYTNAFVLLACLSSPVALLVGIEIGLRASKVNKQSEIKRIKGIIRESEKASREKWAKQDKKIKHVSLRDEFLLDLEINR